MTAFPVSVTTALWATSGTAARPGRTLDDELAGLLGGPPQDESPVQTWHRLGERRFLVALPLPGRPGLLPAGGPGFREAALAAGECVLSPTLGGALVPVVTGDHPLDQVVTWSQHDTAPLDVRRVQALDAGEARQDLAHAIEECLTELGRVDETAIADLGDIIEHSPRGGAALPPGIPPRLAALMDLAQRVIDAADAGLDPRAGTVSAHATVLREHALRTLHAVAVRTLETAANLAVLGLARQA